MKYLCKAAKSDFKEPRNRLLSRVYNCRGYESRGDCPHGIPHDCLKTCSNVISKHCSCFCSPIDLRHYMKEVLEKDNEK